MAKRRQKQQQQHRIGLICWLSTWLALSIVRQCFDLLGKLWALVVLDLVQILALCTAIFTLLAHHRRHSRPRFHQNALLAAFSLSSFALNVALCLWWCTELLVGEYERERLLAFGLPYGHSFFLRHSPLCSAQFNLTAHRWEQSGQCPFPFSYFEGLQSILHALFAIGTFLFALVALFKAARREGRVPGEEEDDDSRSVEEKVGKRLGHGSFEEQHFNGGSGYMSHRRLTPPPPSSTPPSVPASRRLQIAAPVPPPIRRSLLRQKYGQQSGRGGRENGEKSNYSAYSSPLGTAILANSLSSRSSSSTGHGTQKQQLQQQPLSSSSSPFSPYIYSQQQQQPKSFQKRKRESTATGRQSMRTFTSMSTVPAQLLTDPSLQLPLAINSEQPRTTTGTSLVVTFDPKALGEPIQVREHWKCSSSDEAEEEGQGHWPRPDDVMEEGRGLAPERRLGPMEGVSLESIPSADAPSRLAPTAANGQLQPQKLWPNGTASLFNGQCQAEQRHSCPFPSSGAHISSTPAGRSGKDDGTEAAFRSPPQRPGSASLYDTFLGTGPQDACTAFPVQLGQQPRASAVQLAAVSAIRLSCQDLMMEGDQRQFEEDGGGGGQSTAGRKWPLGGMLV